VPGKLRRFLSHLGPGLISGAANDDPSCISTYSIAGASLGYATLWASPLGLPLVAAVQLMCSRLAIVSGRGLAGAVRQHMPRWVLYSTCLALFAANAVNLGADLGGMAEATEMLTGIPWWIWTPLYAGALLALLVWSSYQRIVSVFKWLALVLFSYIGAGILARPDWADVLRATFIPRFEFSGQFFSALVAIFGATLSPYLFFWQAAQEVEEEYARGRHTVDERQGATSDELRRSRIDVFSGAFVSRLIAYFVTISTAATLHASGKRNISTAAEAAAALEPIAGDAASWLFALGLIGTGMLAVPVLAGSSAYAVSEAAAWRGSLQKQPRLARRFYRVIGFAMLLGMSLKLIGFSAVSMLFWSAAINGVLAPPLILIVVLLTGRREVMGDKIAPPLARWLGLAAFGITAAAALTMLVALAL
jgi:NRAMP (natural resistance-associated macrophage protein)-like metal ion transporter